MQYTCEHLLVQPKGRANPSGVLPGEFQTRFIKLGSVKVVHSRWSFLFSYHSVEQCFNYWLKGNLDWKLKQCMTTKTTPTWGKE